MRAGRLRFDTITNLQATQLLADKISDLSRSGARCWVKSTDHIHPFDGKTSIFCGEQFELKWLLQHETPEHSLHPAGAMVRAWPTPTSRKAKFKLPRREIRRRSFTSRILIM